jgi:integrase
VAWVKDRWEDPARKGGGKRWQAGWRNAEGKERTASFDRKIDAQRHGAAMEAEARAPRVPKVPGAWDPANGTMTLAEYASGKFLPAMLHLRPNSAVLYESHLRTHILPRLGDREMGTLSRTDMKGLVAALAGTLAPATVETVFAVLRALMSAAVDDGVIPANPCTRVPLPRVEPRVIEPLSGADVLALEAALPERYRVLVRLAAGCGLRFGEACGLTVPRVDFMRRKVKVIEQMQNGALAPLKTRASQGTVPVDDWVIEGISAHLARFGPGPDQVIVVNAAGRPVRRSAFGDAWRAAVEAAGLPKGTRFHDLRHFYASALIRSNLNPKVVQARMRHATIAETMDTYGHLFPDSEDLGRGAVEAALSAAADQVRTRQSG